MDSFTLVTQMRELGLWPEDEALQQALLALPSQVPEPRLLARELLQRNLLTPYQANQLLTGKGTSLVVGSYLLQERVGEGGMGQVFKARHARLGRVVALKVIKPEHVKNQTAVQRFLREVEASAKLSHPNVVRAYDAGEAGGTYYFAMQYVDGSDLSRLVKREGPLQVDQACDYIRQAAQGLQHIHEHGMVHRDVKPSNLMMAASAGAGPWGQVKILDLGMARLGERTEAEGQPALTRLGIVMGTVDYMAPEQAIASRRADIRSDIYSLGCTFYMLLTGHAPFPKGEVVEKMMRHQLDPIPPVEQERADVAPAVGQVLVRMLAKKPEERFQTPAEVATALLGVAEPSAVSAVVAVPAYPVEALAVVESVAESESAFAFDQLDDRVGESVRAARLRPQEPEWRLWALLGGAAVAAVLVLTVLLRLLLR